MARNSTSSQPKIEHITYLCRLIEDKFGRRVLSDADCIGLRHSILKVTENTISKDTLRELFGLLQIKKKKSISTLNLLSEYAGFKSWSHVVDIYNAELEYKADFLVYRSIDASRIDFEDLRQVMSKLGQCKKAYTLLHQIIHIAVQKQDELFFNQLFTLNSIFAWDENYRYDIYYTIQLLGSYVQKHKWFQTIAVNNYYGLKSTYNTYNYDYYVELFVDTDHYDEYYRELLERYYQKQNTQRKVAAFRELIIADRDIENGNEITNLRALTKECEQLGIDSHVLAGRWFGIASAYSIWKSHQIAIKKIDDIKKMIRDQGDQVTFLYHAIRNLYRIASNTCAICNEKKKQIFYFAIVLYQQLMPAKELLLSHWADNNLNQLSLYYAAVLTSAGDTESAKQLLKKVSPEFFDRYSCIELMNVFNSINKLICS